MSNYAGMDAAEQEHPEVARLRALADRAAQVQDLTVDLASEGIPLGMAARAHVRPRPAAPD